VEARNIAAQESALLARNNAVEKLQKEKEASKATIATSSSADRPDESTKEENFADLGTLKNIFYKDVSFRYSSMHIVYTLPSVSDTIFGYIFVCLYVHHTSVRT
jgi:hypothetical protein